MEIVARDTEEIGDTGDTRERRHLSLPIHLPRDQSTREKCLEQRDEPLFGLLGLSAPLCHFIELLILEVMERGKEDWL